MPSYETKGTTLENLFRIRKALPNNKALPSTGKNGLEVQMHVPDFLYDVVDSTNDYNFTMI